MHPKSITRKSESACATHSARKPMRSLTPSLSCKACRPRDPNFWKKSMLNAVNHNDKFMQRSSNVGQFQLNPCVSCLPSDQPCFPKLLRIFDSLYSLTAHAAPSTWMQWKAVRAPQSLGTANICACARALAPTGQSPQMPASTRAFECRSEHMHARRRSCIHACVRTWTYALTQQPQ